MRSKKRQLQLLAAKNAGAATSILEKLADDPKVSEQLCHDLLVQTGRYHDWQKTYTAGEITNAEAAAMLTGIRKGLLHIIKDLPDDLPYPEIQLHKYKEEKVEIESNPSSQKILILLTLEIALGFWGEMMPNKIKDALEKWLGETVYTFLWVGIALIMSIWLLRLSVKKDKAKGTNAQTSVSAEEWHRIRTAIQKRYEKRFDQKIDERIQLSMTLSYTQEGFDRQYIEWHFPEESRTTAEIRKNLLDIFEQHGSLLIIGNEGTGKTTLLLDLAISLLESSSIPDAPIPLIINLAQWTEMNQDFRDWMVKAVASTYGFSEQAASGMMAQNRIIPFFDGFDEVATDKEAKVEKERIRKLCITAITEHWKQRMVICSRRDEYKAVEENMPVRTAILVQELTVEKIKAELKVVLDKNNFTADQTPATNIIRLIDENPALQQTLLTPVYFKLAEVVFDEKKLYTNLPTNESEWQTYLKKRYVEEKLTHTQPALFSPDRTRHYLSWLAKNMKNRSTVSFELGDLQPFMLHKPWIFGLIFGLISTLFYSLTLSLAGGLTIINVETEDNAGLIYGIFKTLKDLLNLLTFGLVFGLIFGSLVALVFGLFGDFARSNIETEDNARLNWSRLKSFQSLRRIFIGGLIASLIVGLVFGFFGGLIGGLIGGLVFGLVFGLVYEIREITYFTEVYSPYYRLKAGLFNFPLTGLMALVIASYIADYFISEVEIKMISYFFFVPFSFIFLIISPLFQHFCLRIAFYLEGTHPLGYVTFLEYATRCRILEQDGGHWRFRHQILQDYFAEL